MNKQELTNDYLSSHVLKNLVNLDENVACVLETDPLSKATTIMLSKGFSQLLVLRRMPKDMVLREHIVGVVSLQSIVGRLMVSSISLETPVYEFVEQGQMSLCTEDCSLLSVLDDLEKSEYIVVLDSKRTFVKRLITAFDIAVLYKQKVIPYSQIEFIECFIRDRLVRFGILSSDDAYGEKFVFNDFIGFFATNWQKLKMGSLDCGMFVQLLEKVRVARNAMMHFRTLDTASRKTIEEMVRLLNITTKVNENSMPRSQENNVCSKCRKVLGRRSSVFICIECRRPVCEECWRNGQQLCPICGESIQPDVIK